MKKKCEKIKKTTKNTKICSSFHYFAMYTFYISRTTYNLKKANETEMSAYKSVKTK